MKKFKLVLESGFVVEHLGTDVDAAKEYVENWYKKKVVKIFDLSLELGSQLVYIRSGWFGVDED